MAGPIFNSAFNSPEDEASGLGKRPVVFDILGPDRETSILPESLKLVLHVNPSSMSFQYSMVIERIQTLGGWVEQHWGSAVDTISFEQATGGFMRLFSGLSNVTDGPGSLDLGGSRRETIAYDKFLDLLALFHNNARIYGLDNKIAFQGIIKISFDGQSWFGWFNDFSWTESAEKPYQFDVTTSFSVDFEEMTGRSILSQTSDLQQLNAPFFDGLGGG